MERKIELRAVNTIRGLSLDSVEHSGTGHLGMPLGSATMAYVLWKNIMKHNPKNPQWFNRDRFILTSGHGSILLYSLLHLSGYPMELDDLKSFRRLNSITPGHPEVTDTPGVEATTGPLGQGFAMTIGFAIAEARLAAKYNKLDAKIINHFTYTICGDGDLQEGVALEAASIAGNLGLGKIIALYDSNDITSDGPLTFSSTTSIQKQFEAMNWEVLRVEDGNDMDEIQKAIEQAQLNSEQPTLIEVKTTIGYGSLALQGTEKIHSNPVGPAEVRNIKRFFEWEEEELFFIPEDVKTHFNEIKSEGNQQEKEWNILLDEYKEKYPEEYVELVDAINNKIHISEETLLPFKEEKMATRTASGLMINRLYKDYSNLVGGSADLASSNKTTIENQPFMTNGNYDGPNIRFGVREFAMAATMNGLTLHGGLRGYAGTFLIFSDYMRSAIRHAAIMHTPMIFVMTHDSLQVGPDGPTHQPVEHLISLRAMPNIVVIRPADANETIYAWQKAMESVDRPYVIALGRHDVNVIKEVQADGVRRGAYVLSDSNEMQSILIATGAEVEMALAANKILEQKGYSIRVVSMPSWELFEEQDELYKESILPKNITSRVSVELGSTIGWNKYIGSTGFAFGNDSFGASAQVPELLESIGFTVDKIVEMVIKNIEYNNK